MWGMARTQVANLVKGVTEGYSQTLEIHGVGFRAAMKGKDQLQLQIGFSHDVIPHDPDGRRGQGCRRQAGNHPDFRHRQADSSGRSLPTSVPIAPPEPYQGKGIRYKGEYIFRKEGKKK